MSRLRLARVLTILSAGAVLTAARVPLAGAWGTDGHRYIAQNYSQHLPPGLDGLVAWDAVVIAHVMDPDNRKGSTPGEAPRHFMDIDAYPEFLAGTLSHDRATLEAEYGAATVSARGVLPWAVGEVTDHLTRLFQAADWDSSALVIADLCHYVGDGHQPLHCTQNYDGQFSGNNGVHARYESTMLSMFITDVHTSPAAVSFYASPVDAMFAVIGTSWGGKDTIFQGDNVAKATSAGAFNTLYYQTLWQETQPLTEERLGEASRATASFVYTAWVDAGQPPVPGSTAVAPDAVAGRPELELSPNPFRDALSIRYQGPGATRIEVFDARGARVAEIGGGSASGGAATWSPRAGGSRTPAGLYFVRMSAPGIHVVRRAAYLP